MTFNDAQRAVALDDVLLLVQRISECRIIYFDKTLMNFVFSFLLDDIHPGSFDANVEFGEAEKSNYCSRNSL